jgi:4-hydroxy-tetrahydrodipicolinate reductase
MAETPIRAIVYGVGVSGSRITRLLVKKSIRIVGALSVSSGKVGRDIGEVVGIAPLGVTITNNPVALFTETTADVLLHATSYDPHRIVTELVPPLRAGINVISIAGISYLPGQFPELAAELDAAARVGGATVVGTGLNPGFVQDVLPIVLSSACEDITCVNAVRVTDFSPWGPEVMRHYGIGFREEEFYQGVAAGRIGLHAEIRQSLGMITSALTLPVDEIREERTPLLTDVERQAPHVIVPRGAVCGFRHRASALCRSKPVVVLELCGIINPDPVRDGIEVGTTVTIDGIPNIRVAVQGELGQGEGVYAATVARAVNAIPHVVRAPPGLWSLADLPTMGYWRGCV